MDFDTIVAEGCCPQVKRQKKYKRFPFISDSGGPTKPTQIDELL
jgi:hypothetical protein